MKRNWPEIVIGAAIPLLMAVTGWCWSEITELKTSGAARDATACQIEKRLERMEAKIDRLLEKTR